MLKLPIFALSMLCVGCGRDEPEAEIGTVAMCKTLSDGSVHRVEAVRGPNHIEANGTVSYDGQGFIATLEEMGFSACE